MAHIAHGTETEMPATFVSPGVMVDAGGIIIVGGKPIPIPPWNPEGKLGLLLRDMYVGLVTVHLASSVIHEEAGKELHTAAVNLIATCVKEL